MRTSSLSSSSTFLAKLHPLAAQFNLKPHLSDVTLANILAGDTCAPISLSDFERHLTFVEYSVENLQFLVWYQDYRERYLKLASGRTSPARDNFTFHAPSCARTEQRAAESLARLNTSISISMEDKSLPASPTDAITPTSPSPMLPPQYTQLALPQVAYTVSRSNDPEGDPFRMECERAIATFLSPNAGKELPLDAIIRDTAVRNLSLDCHPDVLMPVYEETYNLLERFSLPRFLSAASTNINLPKQIYWYAVGIINIMIGIVMALLLIMMLPTPPNKNRALRVIAAGFCGVGAAQCYTAWRGYCSQVWLRGNTQLRVWEMQEMDKEAKAFVSRVLDPEHVLTGGAAGHAASSSASSFHEHDEDAKPKSDLDGNVAVIAPFSLETTKGGRKRFSFRSRPSSRNSSNFALSFHRPPVFGPETVVLDPRIKALHRQLAIEVVRFGVCVLLVLAAVLMAVPSRRHS